jgi:hypothetical protein
MSLVRGSALLVLTTALLCGQSYTVVNLSGSRWMANGRPLSAGGQLPATAKVTGGEPAATLLIHCGRAVIEYKCPRGNCALTPCEGKPADMEVHRLEPEAAGLVSPGFFPEGLSGLLNAWLVKSAHAPRTLAVRAGGSPNDALLMMGSDGVHWGPALRRVLEGSYCFRLDPLDGGASTTFRIAWDRALDAEGTVALAGLKPGVYALQKGVAGGCSPDSEASPAWVAIVPKAQFDRLAAEWERGARWLARLADEGTSEQAIGTMRQALLAGLADASKRP